MTVLTAGSAAMLGAVGLVAPLGAMAQESTRLDEISVEGSGQGRGAGRPGGPGRNVVSVSGDPEAGGKGPVEGLVANTSTAGTKTAAPIIETPQSLTVIGRDRIETLQATSASEVFQYTPGINADTYGSNSRSDSYITIRGLPANFFQDNLRLPLTRPYGGYRVDPFMIERLEVLRGPSSVLYGQGGPGGTINYVSKRPTPVPFAMVDMQVGNFEQPRIGMDFGGALNGDGTLSYRMIGVGQNTQLNGGNPFTGQRIALAPSFAWKPDNQTSLIVFGSFLQDDTHIDSDFLPAQGTVLPNPNGRISRRLYTGNTSFDKQIRTQYAIGYEFEHRFNDAFAVRQNLRYATVSTGINTVYGAGINFDDPTFRTINRYAIGGKVGAKAFTLDNQLQADFFLGPTKHTVLVGVDYLNQYSFDQQNFRDGGLLDVFSGIGQPIAPGAPLLLQDERQTISQVGVYFQDQIKFFDRLVLTGGFRYDSAVNDFKDPVNADSSGVSKDSALSPRIGAVYLFDNGFAPYISYSESFSVNPGAGRFARDGDLVSSGPFRPSLGKQEEIGLRYKAPGLPILLSASAFDITQTNVVSTFGLLSYAQDLRSRGYEMEALVEFGNGFRAIGTYTLQDVRVIGSPDEPIEVGTRPTAVPDRIAALWGDYTFLTGDLRGLRLGAGLRYTGGSVGSISLTPIRVPEFFLVDLGVSYAYENWRFSLNIRNLADRKFISACGDPTSCFYGQERKVIVGARYTW
ncbi:TonB-dependent siderophore receptor [Methylorubrum salsuginis]|uniref:Iron complex outermembrane recepter protein n=1 Tax=Methylorubrum salsuginis TaxID=414703 RepID=A0A1I4GBC3_9HYPH|nr:TonB-dependent siderophore receptor [Methylorubrum salsuginis]SFL26843.1 iron complex outermembrane recepter protein [Methylorubrum salsuginis]